MRGLLQALGPTSAFVSGEAVGYTVGLWVWAGCLGSMLTGETGQGAFWGVQGQGTAESGVVGCTMLLISSKLQVLPAVSSSPHRGQCPREVGQQRPHEPDLGTEDRVL